MNMQQRSSLLVGRLVFYDRWRKMNAPCTIFLRIGGSRLAINPVFFMKISWFMPQVFEYRWAGGRMIHFDTRYVEVMSRKLQTFCRSEVGPQSQCLRAHSYKLLFPIAHGSLNGLADNKGWLKLCPDGRKCVSRNEKYRRKDGLFQIDTA